MSTLLRFPTLHDHAAVYRVGRAELHVGAERLLVDGIEVPLSPMAYRLLLGLCHLRGALLTRTDAFNLLWPGGGSGSDEALAQIVLKVRQALGSEGRHLVTVRGRGFRLDLPIEPVQSGPAEGRRLAAPAATKTDAATRDDSLLSAETPSDDHGPATPHASRRWRPAVAAAVVAALALIAMAYWLPARAPTMELPGFAVPAEAFGPISAAGVNALRTAMIREDEGDRGSAARLLEAMFDTEPRSAAPAFFLVLWATGNERIQESTLRRRLLEERLPRDATPYVLLLSRWLLSDDTPGTEIEVLNAALKLQPSAWRLRFARAHVLLRMSRFDDALADMRQVPLEAVPPRQSMFVLGDRAALGDADQMERQLPRLALRSPAVADYVRGRIAAARGRWDAAQAAYESAGARAERDALIGSLSSSWLLAAAAAGMRDRWGETAADADRARRIGMEHDLPALVADADPVFGYAQHRLEQAAQRDASWGRSDAGLRKVHDDTRGARLWLQRARIDPAWGSAHAPATPRDAPDALGMNALVSARVAWLACDMHEAAHQLGMAENAGIDAGYFGDEADLLRQDLDLPRHASAAPPRLPYPWLTRWITYWQSTQGAGQRPCAHAAAAAATSAG
ncbi:winged helix-turn-helix domain-containing protein [Dokdonella soli]|uniref:OmpR/PhoB-type domain-containing protein n=1 Tax=Dokdonella soli TaxID=529810 RepID=A0ABP3TL16_9GAMM